MDLIKEPVNCLNNLMIEQLKKESLAAHSITTALINVYDSIKLAMDNNLLTILVLFDFTQAFPFIVHEIIFRKMFSYGFSGPAVEWLRSFCRSALRV